MKRNTAVALGYTQQMVAPVIVASGKGEMAQAILAIAEEWGISIVKDEILADILSEQDIGSCVPEETWRAVAAIFAFLERGIRDKIV
ncbi:MAG: EscU/YscU/HrcU family type III secretion system export apparatus switch protein [Spirochaetales bacterium]|nr:EscU/YscU/HrcU family type III secretion system export apparatus switch protein [Spirochaetales bacterium]